MTSIIRIELGLDLKDVQQARFKIEDGSIL